MQSGKRLTLKDYFAKHTRTHKNHKDTNGRCENPECRKNTEYGGISRNMAEYHGIWRNITEYHGIFPEYTGTSQYFPMVAMRSALTSKDFSSEIGILQSFKDFFKEFHF